MARPGRHEPNQLWNPVRTHRANSESHVVRHELSALTPGVDGNRVRGFHAFHEFEPKLIVDVAVEVVWDPNPVCIRVQQPLSQGFAGVARLARSFTDEEQYYDGHQNEDRGLPHAATPVWFSTKVDG